MEFVCRLLQSSLTYLIKKLTARIDRILIGHRSACTVCSTRLFAAALMEYDYVLRVTPRSLSEGLWSAHSVDTEEEHRQRQTDGGRGSVSTGPDSPSVKLRPQDAATSHSSSCSSSSSSGEDTMTSAAVDQRRADPGFIQHDNHIQRIVSLSLL